MNTFLLIALLFAQVSSDPWVGLSLKQVVATPALNSSPPITVDGSQGAGDFTGSPEQVAEIRKLFGWKLSLPSCGMAWCGIHGGGWRWQELADGERPDRGEAVEQAVPAKEPGPEYTIQYVPAGRFGRRVKTVQVPVQRQPEGADRDAIKRVSPTVPPAAVQFQKLNYTAPKGPTSVICPPGHT